MERQREFSDFYSQHRGRLVAALTRGVEDTSLAAEAVDEAMVRAYERWGRVGRLSDPAGWVYVTARNVARRRFTRHGREAAMVRDQATVVREPAGETWLLVDALPPRQREAVVLRHLVGLTEQAVATAMGIKRGTVSSTLRHAYVSLGAQLDCDADQLEREEVPR